MKQPKMTGLRVDPAGTKKIRNAMKQPGSIKITVNIDADSLTALRDTALRTGIPYQRLLNQILKAGLAGQRANEDRLDRIERELARLKKKRVA